eukprot:1384761-Rhodomonas_salina.1
MEPTFKTTRSSGSCISKSVYSRNNLTSCLCTICINGTGPNWSTLDASPPNDGPDVSGLLDDLAQGVFGVVGAAMLDCCLLGVPIDCMVGLAMLDCCVLGAPMLGRLLDDPAARVFNVVGAAMLGGCVLVAAMLALAEVGCTGGRPKVPEEGSLSTGFVMLMDCVADEASMVRSGLHHAGCYTTTFMLWEIQKEICPVVIDL